MCLASLQVAYFPSHHPFSIPHPSYTLATSTLIPISLPSTLFVPVL
uniref:Uncharacterized protein n=1 Tax=Octopus bimaculoides TaxID=37653 RepID=A0A0L8FIL6_OCTBM